jgi:hypothetical protein
MGLEPILSTIPAVKPTACLVRMVIGNVGEYIVEYDKHTDIVTCKDVSVKGVKLIEGYESTLDRVTVGYSNDRNVVLRKSEHDLTLGCLRMSNQIGEQLIKQIKRCKQ